MRDSTVVNYWWLAGAVTGKRTAPSLIEGASRSSVAGVEVRSLAETPPRSPSKDGLKAGTTLPGNGLVRLWQLLRLKKGKE